MNYKSTFALALLMALTRFHHFGSALSLPDASLAVFFLAGWFVLNWRWFAALLLEAGLIDYLAIAQGTSDYCVTHAYIGLLPTYALMFIAGQYAKRNLNSVAHLLTVTAYATGASLLAFLISNGSFYLLSGYFDAMTLLDYSRAIAAYLSPYLMAALMYIGTGLLLHRLFASMPVTAWFMAKQ